MGHGILFNNLAGKGSDGKLMSFFSRSDGIYTGDKPVNVREIEKRILDKVLDTNRYDNKIRPDGTAGTGKCTFPELSFLIISTPFSFLYVIQHYLWQMQPWFLSTCSSEV